MVFMNFRDGPALLSQMTEQQLDDVRDCCQKAPAATLAKKPLNTDQRVTELQSALVEVQPAPQPLAPAATFRPLFDNNLQLVPYRIVPVPRASVSTLSLTRARGSKAVLKPSRICQNMSAGSSVQSGSRSTWNCGLCSGSFDVDGAFLQCEINIVLKQHVLRQPRAATVGRYNSCCMLGGKVMSVQGNTSAVPGLTCLW